MSKSYFLILCCSLFYTASFAQGSVGDPLYNLLFSKDSMIFERGYNAIDMVSLEKVLSDDLEMYHDQQGMLNSKEQLIAAMGSLANMPFRSRRELIEGSLEVFPLTQQGKLYGAIQRGEHRFWAKEDGKEEYITSTAKFTSVWIKEEDGEWRLRRSLSFDHQAPKH